MRRFKADLVRLSKHLSAKFFLPIMKNDDARGWNLKCAGRRVLEKKVVNNYTCCVDSEG